MPISNRVIEGRFARAGDPEAELALASEISLALPYEATVAEVDLALLLSLPRSELTGDQRAGASTGHSVPLLFLL